MTAELGTLVAATRSGYHVSPRTDSRRSPAECGTPSRWRPPRTHLFATVTATESVRPCKVPCHHLIWKPSTGGIKYGIDRIS
jgi:hypothetical protein